MVDVTYTPTFHHDFWVDRRDRCEAEGSNGFNARFQAIQSDLQQLSTVVDELSVAIAAIAAAGANPLPVPNVVTFTPVLRATPGAQPWSTGDTGAQGSFFGVFGSLGVANIAPPDGVTLTGIRVVGDFNGDFAGEAEMTITVSRVPVRLTSPPTAPVVIASAFTGFFPTHYDTVMTVAAANAVVDLNAFRYFITADGVDLGSGNFSTIDFVQFQFTRPAP